MLNVFSAYWTPECAHVLCPVETFLMFVYESDVGCYKSIKNQEQKKDHLNKKTTISQLNTSKVFLNILPHSGHSF